MKYFKIESKNSQIVMLKAYKKPILKVIENPEKYSDKHVNLDDIFRDYHK